MLNLKGIPINQGIAEGPVFIKINPVKTIPKKSSIQNPSAEIETYLQIITSLQQEFQKIKFKNSELSDTTNQQMADLYIALLNDPVFKIKIPKLIMEQKISIAHAILKKLEIIKQEFAKIENEYFRSRFDDFESIGHKLLEKITGSGSYENITKPKIIIAESISAVDLLHIPLENILGIITETGGVTSHAAILAESLGIPAVFGVQNLIENINKKEIIIMDGYSGDVIVNPTHETSLFYQNLTKRHSQYEQDLLDSTQNSYTTKDGHPISLLANIGNPYDVPLIHKYNADGIGLLRTETIVLLEESFLSEEEQTLYYETILKATNNLPVYIRTLDLGGDKTIQNATITPLNEDNPFLGFRSTRLFVQDPTEFKKQIYALLKAYPINPNIRIIIPFVTTLDDFLILKSLILDYYQEIYNDVCPIPIGMMAEVPSTIICIEDYLPHVDFISVGTNDLTQYILATDRNNVYVTHYHTSAHPAIIKLLTYVGEKCKQYNIPISLCGEMGKEPHFIRLLYGMDINSLSMSLSGIPMARYILANSTLEECQQIVKTVLPMKHPYQIEEFLHQDLIIFLKKQDAYFDNCIVSTKTSLEAQ